MVPGTRYDDTTTQYEYSYEYVYSFMPLHHTSHVYFQPCAQTRRESSGSQFPDIIVHTESGIIVVYEKKRHTRIILVLYRFISVSRHRSPPPSGPLASEYLPNGLTAASSISTKTQELRGECNGRVIRTSIMPPDEKAENITVDPNLAQDRGSSATFFHPSSSDRQVFLRATADSIPKYKERFN